MLINLRFHCKYCKNIHYKLGSFKYFTLGISHALSHALSSLPAHSYWSVWKKADLKWNIKIKSFSTTLTGFFSCGSEKKHPHISCVRNTLQLKQSAAKVEMFFTYQFQCARERSLAQMEPHFWARWISKMKLLESP